MSIDITVSPPFSQNGHKPIATHSVYLALGSNMGDRRGNLAAALQRLREVIEIPTISSIYETEPVGYLDQPRFFNIVCYGKTALTAQELLNYVKDILIGNEGNQQWFHAVFDLYADLGANQAGVHMSRFSDALDEVMEGIDTTAWPRIEMLAEHIARTIVEKQKALRAEVHIRAAYPLQRWTPVSGRPTQEVYGLMAQAVATRDSSRHMIGVEV